MGRGEGGKEEGRKGPPGGPSTALQVGGFGPKRAYRLQSYSLPPSLLQPPDLQAPPNTPARFLPQGLCTSFPSASKTLPPYGSLSSSGSSVTFSERPSSRPLMETALTSFLLYFLI